MTPDPSTEAQPFASETVEPGSIAALAQAIGAEEALVIVARAYSDVKAKRDALAARLSQAERQAAAAREFIAYTKDNYGHLLHGSWHAHARIALAASSAGETPE